MKKDVRIRTSHRNFFPSEKNSSESGIISTDDQLPNRYWPQRSLKINPGVFQFFELKTLSFNLHGILVSLYFLISLALLKRMIIATVFNVNGSGYGTCKSCCASMSISFVSASISMKY